GGLALVDLQARAAALRVCLARGHRLRFRVGGPFSGVRNLGRLYFMCFPEEPCDTEGPDAFELLQDAAGVQRTPFYLLGYYNLLDELTPSEAADLNAFLERWWDVTIAELEVSRLLLIATHDDLALDIRVIHTLDR